MKSKNINRRQFVRKTVGTAVGLVGLPYFVPSSVFGKSGVISPSNRIVMGAIGVGSMGQGDLQEFVHNNEVQMVAVCDVDRGHREQAKAIVDKKYGNGDCKTYLDFRELLGRGDLDAVQLALPDQWHGIIAVAAARAGLDIFGQKPLARTIHESRAIVEAVKRYNCVWQTGSQQRSDDIFHHSCELVRNGRIGKVRRVEVGLPDGHASSETKGVMPVPDGLDWDFWLGPAPKVPYRGVCHWDWRWIMDYSGGQLTDWAGHHIDIAKWGLGLERSGPVEIEGVGQYPQEGIYNAPYAYKFTCKYADGLEMIVANGSQQPKGGGATWYGEKGWINVDRSGIKAEPESVIHEIIGPNEIRLYKSRDHKQNFLDCIKTRQETVAPAEIAHRSISVALLGEIAMLTGRKLKWDPEKEQFINDPGANRMLSRPMRSPWHL
jgi:predicted dehydrogenase